MKELRARVAADPRVPRELARAPVPLPAEFSRRVSARARRRRRTSAPTARRSTIYGADALKRGRRADVVVLPDGADQVSAVMKLCALHRVPLVPRGGGTGYTGGCGADSRRRRAVARAHEPHPGDRRENLVAIVEPNVITGDLQDGGREGRPVLSARSGVAAALGDRRQRRRVRRRPARVQVRDDQAVRARPAGRAAQRRHHRDRRQGREERRRLRPDAPAGRIRGDAGDHHAHHPAPGAEAAGAVDAARDVRDDRRRGAGGQQRDQARASCRRRWSSIDGDSLEAVANYLERPLAGARRDRGAAAARSGRAGRGGRRGGRALRARVPRGRRNRGPARRR